MSIGALSNTEALLTFAGLAAVTVITRSTFFISAAEWSLPQWLEKGLRYAPLAALSAVIAPEIVMTNGSFVLTWQDARLWAALAGALFYFWQKKSSYAVLGTIVTGMAVYLPLHLGLQW